MYVRAPAGDHLPRQALGALPLQAHEGALGVLHDHNNMKHNIIIMITNMINITKLYGYL